MYKEQNKYVETCQKKKQIRRNTIGLLTVSNSRMPNYFMFISLEA